MSHITEITDHNYIASQYRDASNLQARIHLHQRFSTNQYGWYRWIFDQFNLPPQGRLLELGCGSGDLWRENLPRIPADWEITLSDFSAGMLQQAEHKLSQQRQFRFEVVDAQDIPFDNEYFDAVIANHMLYHVPDKAKAFSEIRRVLKPGGRFYAATVGQGHLRELSGLLSRFDAELISWNEWIVKSFTLENGVEQLSHWFTHITLCRYEDSFIVTEAAPLVDYILSGQKLSHERQVELAQFVEREMELCDHTFYITKASGLFTAWLDQFPQQA